MRFQTEKPKEQRRWFSEKGQSVVEFAVVVPLLAFMLFVIADFGRIFFVSVAVNNAARAGAQIGSQGVNYASNTLFMQVAACNDYGLSTTAAGFPTSTCKTKLNPTASECTCVSPPGPITACSTISSTYCKDSSVVTYVTVNTSATFKTILNYPGLSGPFNLTGQAIMQVQRNE
jgi:Flp pilus assembly protein TadG